MAIMLDLDPKVTKVMLIGILIALEAFFIPLYAHLQAGSFPDALDLATWIASAVIQEITYWLVFLKTGEKEESVSK